jgi:hypothetical protein
MHSRRSFLTGVGGAAFVAGTWPGLAHAAGITPFTTGTWMTPPYKVLEILQVGGASHIETTCLHHPTQTSAWWHAAHQVNWASAVAGNPLHKPTIFETREVARPGSPSGLYMGPCAKPLWGSALWDRLRLSIVAHDLDPHHPARVLGLTGTTLGRASKAGLGSMVQAMENLAPSPGVVSYVLDTGSAETAQAAALYGLLGAGARPLVIPINPWAGDFVTRLLRGSSPERDALLREYADRYAARLTFSANQQDARSVSHEAYRSALDRLDSAQDVHDVLATGPSLSVSGPYTATHNRTVRAIEVATHLLANGARHVCVLDNGSLHNYDTHGANSAVDHSTRHGVNTWSVFWALRQALSSGLDLDTTLVHMYSEFGRSNDATSDGTHHWYRGYPHLTIGGPIQAGGPLVRGALTFPGGAADQTGGIAGSGFGNFPYTPTQLRAATALAAGVEPIASGLFTLDDLSTTFTSNAAAHLGLERQFLR